MSEVQNEAYRPVIEDGRGIFPEDLRVKAPRESRQAIAMAAELTTTTAAEWIRQSILRELGAAGIRLRRGSVERVELAENLDGPTLRGNGLEISR